MSAPAAPLPFRWDGHEWWRGQAEKRRDLGVVNGTPEFNDPTLDMMDAG